MGIGAEISIGPQLKPAFPRLSARQAEQQPENVAHIPGEVASCYASNAARGACCIKTAVGFCLMYLAFIKTRFFTCVHVPANV